MVSFLWSGFAYSQNVNATIQSVSACPGSTNVKVPVTVDNLSNVAAISLTLKYTSAQLTYTGYTSGPSILGAVGGNLIVNFNQAQGKIILSWYSMTPLPSVPNGDTIFTFKFTVNGSSNVTWDVVTQGACEFTDIDGYPYTTNWTNGGITAALPNADFTSTPSVCAGSPASVSVDFTSGTAPFTIVYNDGVNPDVTVTTSEDPYVFTENITGSTTWNLVSISTTTCSNLAVNKVTTTNLSAGPTAFNVTGGGSVCAGGLGILLGLDGSETDIDYTLFQDGVTTGITVAGTGAAIGFGEFSTAATYTVVGNSACGTTDMIGNAVIVNSTGPEVSLAPFANVCKNSAIIDLIGGLPLGGTYSGDGVASGVFNPSLFGPGTATITYTYSENGCTGSASQTIVVEATPLVTLDTHAPVCMGSAAFVLNGLPEGGVFEGIGMNGNIFDPSLAGVGTWSITYTYTAEGSAACIGSATIEITVNASPVIIFDALGSICENGTPIEMLQAFPAGGTFSGNGVEGSMFFPALAGVGTFPITYSYTDLTGCSASAVQDITVTAAPVITFAVIGPFCSNANPVDLDAAVSPAGGTFTGTAVFSGDTQNFYPEIAGPGVFTLSYQYSDASGCSAVASQDVTVFDVPTAIVSNDAAICVGGTATLSLQISNGQAPYVFAFNDGITTETIPTEGYWESVVMPTSNTSYTFQAITDANGCPAADATVSVTVTPLPEITFPAIAPVCGNAEPFALTASPAGGTFTGLGVTDGVFYPASMPAGTYTVTYNYAEVVGCGNSGSIDITILPLTEITVQPDGITASEGTTVSFSITAINATGYQWQVSTDGGLVWTDLSDDAVYSGVNTDLLVINGVTNAMHGNLYHAIASGVCAPAAISTDATLNTTPGIVTTAGSAISCNASTFMIPVTVDNLNDVAALSLTLDYGTNVTFEGYQDVNAAFDPGFLSINANGGHVKVSYFNVIPLNIGSGLLFNLLFTATTGTSNLVWDLAEAGNCEYLTLDYAVLSSQYVNGTIEIPAVPELVLASVGPLCADAAPVTLSATPDGGAFVGSGVMDGVFYPEIAGIGTTTITYTLTYGNNCTATASQEISVSALPEVSIAAVAPVCPSAEAVVLNGTPSGGNYTGIGVTDGTFLPVGLAAGMYTVTYSFTDLIGCSNSASVEITILPATEITVNPADVSTNAGNPASFSVTAMHATAYQWQVSTDAGLSWTDLTDDATYSGVTTDQLNISATTSAMHGNFYHAVVSGLCAPAAVSAYATLSTSAGIITTVGSAIACEASTFVVPVTVENLNDVAALSLTLGYGSNVSFVGYQDLNPAIDTGFLSINATGTQVKFSYFNVVPLNIGSGLFVNLLFSATAGSSSLSWDVTVPGNCEYLTIDYVALSSTFVDGSIEILASPEIILNPVGPFCITAEAVALNATPAGGIYTGDVDENGVFNPAAAGAGTHTITYAYTNAEGCAGVTASINIVVNALPEVSFTAPATVCSSSSPVALVATPEGGIFSGPGVVDNTFDPAIAGIGVFSLTYTFTDLNGCSNSASSEITVCATPEVTFSPITAVCINAGGFALSAAPVGGTFSGIGVVDGMFYPEVAGAGIWTITYTYTNCGVCTSSASQDVTVNALPVVLIDAVLPLCASAEAVTLSGSPQGGTFSGTGVVDGTFSPAVAGPGTFDILYSYTDLNGCANSATTQITVYTAPEVTITAASTSVCANAEAVALTGTPAGGTFSGTGVTGDFFYPVTGVGAWTVTYSFTTESGCSASASTVITVNAMPIVMIEPVSPVCATAPAFALIGQPVGGIFTGPGVVDGIFNPASVEAGIYEINYAYTNEFGCSSSAQGFVTVVATPTVTFDAIAPVCATAAAFSLSASPAGGEFSGTGVSGNMFDPAVSGVGSFVVTYSYTNESGCSASATQTVVVNAAATATLSGGGVICAGNTASIHIDFLTGTPPFTATFDGGIVVTTNENMIDLSYTPAATTVYTLVSAQDANGCITMINQSVEITVNAIPAAFNVSGGGAYCSEGMGVTIGLDGSETGVIYTLVFNGESTSSTLVGTGSALAFNNVMTAGTYTISATTAAGCTASMTSSATVSINAGLSVSAGDDVTIAIGGSTSLSATVTGGTEPFTYLWVPATGLNDAALATVVASPATTTTYTLMVMDALNCMGVDDVIVTVLAPQNNLSGTITYPNVANSPLANVVVTLSDANGVEADQVTTTDAAGHYAFNDLAFSNYTLQASSTHVWGGGNAVDGLLMLRHFVGLQFLTGLKLEAGDVTGNHVINAHDGLNTLRRFVGLLPNFAPVGDWVFEHPGVVIDGIANQVVNFNGLCTGDVNADYAVSGSKVAPTVVVNETGTVYASNGTVTVPVIAEQNMSIGSVTMFVTLPSQVNVTAVNIKGDNTNLVYNVIGNELRIGWFNLEPMTLVAGENLLTITLSSNAKLDGLSLKLDGNSLLSDNMANVIDQAQLRLPKISTQAAELSLNSFPNPVNTNATFTYTLAEAGKVMVEIYNTIGERVAVVTNEFQDAGFHSLSFDATGLSQGVYVSRLTVNGTSVNKVISINR